MKHLPLDFWAAFNARFSGQFLLGELLDGDPSVVARTWSAGRFSALFDFPLAFAMGDVFCDGAPSARLGAVLTNDRRYPDPSKLVTLVDNHDLPRVMSRCHGDVEKVKRALTFLFEARGIPSMAWGTEQGFSGEREPENRASMRFDQTHPLVTHVREALKRRSAHPSLSDGVPVVLSADADHLLLARLSDHELALTCLSSRGTRTARAYGEVVTCAHDETRFVTGDFAAERAQAETQWRTGAKTVAVVVKGPPGTRVVGSGPEFGDWTPAKALTLPATVHLPVHGVFEVKLMRGTEWAPGANELLFVDGAKTVELDWR